MDLRPQDASNKQQDNALIRIFDDECPMKSKNKRNSVTSIDRIPLGVITDIEAPSSCINPIVQ